MNSKPFVHSLHLYPVKSCRAVDANRLFAGARGFMSGIIGDRSWMIVDDKGIMISQRESPELARVKVDLLYDHQGVADKIRLSAPGSEPIILDPAAVGEERQKAALHGKEIIVHVAPESVSRWFAAFLGRPAAVVYQKQEDIRSCSPNYAVNPCVDIVSLADGYPYLVVTLGMLEKLNTMLESPVPMNRFRPNIVIGGAPADSEYSWKQIKIGATVLAFVKPCTRCVVTTVDQEIGVRAGKQPLATLAATNFLAQDFGASRVQGAVFGENAIPLLVGDIAVGDEVEIVETKLPYQFKKRGVV